MKFAMPRKSGTLGNIAHLVIEYVIKKYTYKGLYIRA
jgi:hypothetical protein